MQRPGRPGCWRAERHWCPTSCGGRACRSGWRRRCAWRQACRWTGGLEGWGVGFSRCQCMVVGQPKWCVMQLTAMHPTTTVRPHFSPSWHLCRCRKLSELKKSERAALVTALTRFPLAVSGHEGYAKAEVRQPCGGWRGSVWLLVLPGQPPILHLCLTAFTLPLSLGDGRWCPAEPAQLLHAGVSPDARGLCLRGAG